LLWLLDRQNTNRIVDLNPKNPKVSPLPILQLLQLNQYNLLSRDLLPLSSMKRQRTEFLFCIVFATNDNFIGGLVGQLKAQYSVQGFEGSVFTSNCLSLLIAPQSILIEIVNHFLIKQFKIKSH
jgi:hypothetical protein